MHIIIDNVRSRSPSPTPRYSRSPSPTPRHSRTPSPTLKRKTSQPYSRSPSNSPSRNTSQHRIRTHRNTEHPRAANSHRTFRYTNCQRCGFNGHASDDCKTIQCSKCRGFGHRQRDCSTRVCNLCEKLGHITKDCRTTMTDDSPREQQRKRPRQHYQQHEYRGKRRNDNRQTREIPDDKYPRDTREYKPYSQDARQHEYDDTRDSRPDSRYFYI